MMLTLDLEAWFKVSAHPLPTLWVKYEPAKGREDMLRTSDLGRTNGQGRTDGLITIGHPQSGALMIKTQRTTLWAQ